MLGEKLVDRVYLPDQKNPIELRENHAALGMLALARDEAHRASNALRVKLGHKTRLKSRLDEIPGIGPKTRARLLKTLGSVQAIEQADAIALRNAGATDAQALAILREFHGPVMPELADVPSRAAHGQRLVELSSESVASDVEEQAEQAALDSAFGDGPQVADAASDDDETSEPPHDQPAPETEPAL